jgi:hypothetical protein
MIAGRPDLHSILKTILAKHDAPTRYGRAVCACYSLYYSVQKWFGYKTWLTRLAAGILPLPGAIYHVISVL